jgi:hypothetical protein
MQRQVTVIMTGFRRLAHGRGLETLVVHQPPAYRDLNYHIPLPIMKRGLTIFFTNCSSFSSAFYGLCPSFNALGTTF